MMILNPEADAERHDEIVARVRALIEEGGGEVADVSRWSRRKIAYPMRKQGDGAYVVVSCRTSPQTLDEIGRVLSIARDVVLRALPIRASAGDLEKARASGIPEPVDERPEGEARPRGGRRGGRRR